MKFRDDKMYFDGRNWNKRSPLYATIGQQVVPSIPLPAIKFYFITRKRAALKDGPYVP